MQDQVTDLEQLDRAAERRDHHAEFVKHHPEFLKEQPAAAERVERLHPTIVDLIAADSNLEPRFAAILTRQSQFHARVGDRRAFSTSAGAVAFERGYGDYMRDQTEPPGCPYGPRWEGYMLARFERDEALAVVPHRRSEEPAA